MRRFWRILFGITIALSLMLTAEWAYERPAAAPVLLDTHTGMGAQPLRAIGHGGLDVLIYRGEEVVAVVHGHGARVTGARFRERDGRLMLETRDADAMVHEHDVARLVAMPDPGRALSQRVLRPAWEGIGAPLSRRLAALLPTAPPQVLYETDGDDRIILAPAAAGFFVERRDDQGTGIDIFDGEGKRTGSIPPNPGQFLILQDVNRDGRYLLVRNDRLLAYISGESTRPLGEAPFAIHDAVNGQRIWSPEGLRNAGVDSWKGSIVDPLTLRFDQPSPFGNTGVSNVRTPMFTAESIDLGADPRADDEGITLDHGRYRLRYRQGSTLTGKSKEIEITGGMVASLFVVTADTFVQDPSGTRFAVYGADGHVEIRDPPGLLARLPEVSIGTEASFAFSHDGDWLVATPNDDLKIFDSRTGTLLHGISGADIPYFSNSRIDESGTRIQFYVFSTSALEPTSVPVSASSRKYRLMVHRTVRGVQQVELHDLRHLRGLLGWGQAWAARLWHGPKQLIDPVAARPPVTVVIDPLGGGLDELVAYTTEQGENVQGGDIALAFAQRLEKAFKESEVLRPLLTRTADIAVSRQARNAFIREQKPAVVIQTREFGADEAGLRLYATSDEAARKLFDLLDAMDDDRIWRILWSGSGNALSADDPDSPGPVSGRATMQFATPARRSLQEAMRSPDWQEATVEALRKALENWHEAGTSVEAVAR